MRCAIDIQESLRTRNRAYPPSRQMTFRIGITIGDVVERDGDLLGDGVNIAARLESIAPVGGICVSRTVFEQVANKLSVQFADIGEQEVKNIPNPARIHCRGTWRSRDGVSAAQGQNRQIRPVLPLLAALALVAIAAFSGGAYFLTQDFLKLQGERKLPAPLEVMLSGASSRRSPPGARPAENFVAENVPIISDRFRRKFVNETYGAGT